MNVVLPAPDPTSWLSGVTTSTFIPLCVTVTCCELTPVPDIVIVAVLEEDNVLAV